ncbi:double-stranded RNA-binding protein 1-like isoform X2 [Rosa rugosa]|uniref:double-stranded RNA-binding protein 1-like isoform X2 n=1 Tax=Rosa rugosa TaxID=74645 RepID=UPI002B40A431|nr:double-stranded RNA-binding protein 1-like isoform X2 [Rosa rugosa]
MFKSKLQELCQKKAWPLPEYSSKKEGLDHDPRFSATVKINGLEFNTVDPFRSSKLAQNDVARLAFDHFSAPATRPIPFDFPQPSLVAVTPSGLGTDRSFTNTPLQLQKTQETHQAPQVSVNATDGGSQISGNATVDGSQVSGNATVAGFKVSGNATVDGSQVSDNATVAGFKVSGNATVSGSQVSATGSSSQISGRALGVEGDKRSKDIQHLHKNQLQCYAQKRNLILPVYSCEREGPPHAARFKCTVTIDGKTYQGQEFLPTVKDAEHAAAEVALISLLPNGVKEDDSGLYKNLLQELIQKEGQHVPLYSTRTSGEPHMLTFVSTVEIGGESFTGQVARSKKLAEVSAAKVAYNTLRDRKSSQIPLFLTQASQGQEGLQFLSSNAPSYMAPDLQQQVRPNAPKISIPNSVTPQEKEISVAAVGTSHQSTTVSSGVDNRTVGGGFTSSGTVPGRVLKTSRSASPASQSGSSSTSTYFCTSNMDSTLQPPAKRTTSYSNMVAVHPRMLNMTLPEDCVVLSLSDETWVAVSPMKTEGITNQ